MPADLADETLARDVFPAEVLMPDGTLLQGVRVFVSSHRMLVFSANRERVIDLAAAVDLSESHSIAPDRGTLPNAARLEIRTSEGTAWVNRGRGCGCGSPLKALASPISWTHR